MNRAQRRRAERQAKKSGRSMLNAPEIKLESPVRDHFETFIVANWLRMMVGKVPIEVLQKPDRYFDQLVQASKRTGWYRCEQVVEESEAEGQHIVICGAGPSLADHIDEYAGECDQLWGCNSALIWLHEHGYNPTHGYCIDQTPAMVNEWRTMPDVEYLIASTVHPHLLEMLLANDRRVKLFNNYVGIEKPPVEWADDDGQVRGMAYEDWLYAICYMTTIRCGSGLNSVTRAIDVARWMGAGKITVLGADCALRVHEPMPADCAQGSPEHLAWLREHVQMHVDGGNALASGATAVTLGGEIDGVWWESKPDMIVSAVWLVKMKRMLKDRLEVVGDTLPNALMDKPDEFLLRLPTLTGTDGKPIMPPDEALDAEGW